jgi:hypothetical protein
MTGQQRKFKINMSDGKPVFVQHDKNKDVINIMPQKSDPPRRHGWYLGAGRIAQNQNGLILQIMPLSKKDRDATDEKIKLLLCLISRWAGIGAKQQHGYGIFDIYEKINTENKRLEIDENEFDAMIQKLKNPPERPRNEAPGDTLPSLKNFFFAKVRLDGLSGGWQNSVDGAQTALNDADQKARFGSWHTQHDSRIFAPALKNQLRYVVFNGHTPVQKELFKELFGDISVKKGAKVNVSHVYDNGGFKEVRVWGDVSNVAARSEIFEALNGKIYPPATTNIWQAATGCDTVTAQIWEWREINGRAARCRQRGGAPTCATLCTSTSPEAFLKCLLRG